MGMLVQRLDVEKLVRKFQPLHDGRAAKSQELVLELLARATSPFSRNHFGPGHITCTAAILSPDRHKILLVQHRRLRRWLLPGGHVETHDELIQDVAYREAMEETGVQIPRMKRPNLVGIDVHFIPAKGKEPYHLHHALIFGFKARGEEVEATEEVRDVVWCRLRNLSEYEVPESVVHAAARCLEG